MDIEPDWQEQFGQGLYNKARPPLKMARPSDQPKSEWRYMQIKGKCPLVSVALKTIYIPLLAKIGTAWSETKYGDFD